MPVTSLAEPSLLAYRAHVILDKVDPALIKQGASWAIILIELISIDKMLGLFNSIVKVLPLIEKLVTLKSSLNMYAQFPVQTACIPLDFTKTLWVPLAVFKNL